MTLSELIKQLQEDLKRYGDVKVGVWGEQEIEDPEPKYFDDLGIYIL